MPDSPATVPRLTYLRIKNYRALRDVEFRDLTPLTVLIGPNGSGKSTVLDALDFLAEAVRGNLVGAWEKRNRFQGMRTRGEEGNIEFEIGVKVINRTVRYLIAIEERSGTVRVQDEKMSIHSGNKIMYVFYKKKEDANEQTKGVVATNYYASEIFKGYKAEMPNNFLHLFFQHRSQASQVSSVANELDTPGIELANFLLSYRLFHLTDDHLKGYSDAGPREKLSPNGDNLPNVLYYLHDKHPETLEKITAQLRRWVPQLADVVPEITSDERLLLRFKDTAFEKPLPAQYMSGGTMRLAALLTLLYEPGAAGLLGIEEPENELHPHLLPYLAEELIAASEQRQLLVATHAPGLLNALEPEQVWILHRGPDGYTQATRTADLPGIPTMVEEGSPLGYLWARNFFDVGSPLASPQAAE